MINIPNLDRQKFENILTNKKLSLARIFCILPNIAILIGVILTFVNYFRHLNNEAKPEASILIFNLLFGLVLVITILMFYLYKLLLPKTLTRLANGMLLFKNKSINIITKIITAVSFYYVIILSPIFFAALIGLKFLDYSISMGMIYNNNHYWICLAPIIILNIITYLNYPKKENVIQLVHDQILNQKFE